MNLLSAAEQIVELALDSKLSKEFYRKAGKYIKYLSARMELTKEQCVLLAFFLNNSENSRITIKDFGDYLNCSTVKMMSCLTDIDVLEKRDFVICRHGEQNIILQEMEKLDGILIATTNLVENLDKAFERRFLYKIKFEKPNLEARMNIWQEMIPGLDADDTRMLATKYNFSGGQIENIARHYTIGNILHGDAENVLERISEYCDNERLDSKEIRKIVF